MKNEKDYSEFQGKRILFLGAHALTIHLINKAKEMGMYTIVTDYIKNAPAKQFADESFDISTLDVDALVKLAKDKNVDAVFTGYADINLAPCCMVCERLGLPFYASLEQLDATMNKINFKANCRKHNIKVVDDVPEEFLDGSFDRVDYPVIVKPADSYGSKGISVCHCPNEMQSALDKATKVSICKKVLIEPFIDSEDVYLYFTVQNGVLSLSAMADRLMSNEQYGYAPQPAGYFFPSKYIALYFKNIHQNLQNMIADLGIMNGSFFMQGFIVDNDIVFFEMGLRLSGGAGYLHIAHQNEINHLEMHLRYAVTGKFDGWNLTDFDDPHFKNPACVLVILLKDGTIADITGLDNVLANKNVFDIIQFKKVGDILEEHGTLNQVFARIYIAADNNYELNSTIDYIKNTLKITDTNGNNMILNL